MNGEVNSINTTSELAELKEPAVKISGELLIEKTS